ncbi:DUF3990 domain-containing protein [[Clostridium] aminophilum]|uniref:DUF3990 domain-containing protein n=1 Tax=[Clostridium] aminophilum TaxID=1526 RepID=UPI0033169AF0
MIVYHGSIEIVKNPDVNHSFRPLDFGMGFYVTTVKEQAEKWAHRKAEIMNAKQGIINVYKLSEDRTGLKEKTFPADLMEWIDFVCKCRDGNMDYAQYDLISGKVANDKVFRVVDMYHQGIWEKERALKEIKVYQTYDQIAFITQKAIDQLLTFDSYYEV